MNDLYPHQLQALRRLSNGKILWGGVGTGKSRVAAIYYQEKEAPGDVYVITTAKKRDSGDWQDEFYRIGIGPRTGPGRVGGDSAESAGANCARMGNGGRRGSRRDSPVLGKSDRAQCDRDQCSRGSSHTLHDCDGEDPGGCFAGGGALQESGSGRAPSSGRRLAQGATNHPTDSGYSHFIGETGVYPYVLTVDSWNNIAKYADVAGAFFIFDEQRLVGSGDWTRKFLRIAKHNRWVLLSGTPGDTWMDYVPVFIANGFYKNRTEFKHQHVVYNTFTKFPKVDRYINVGRLARQRAELLVEMPYVRHTRRQHVEVPLPYDKDALDLVLRKRWHVFEERPLRDVAEMCSVSRRVVNGDPSRLEMVRELWKIHPKLIVFYNFNYELESLRSLQNYFDLSKNTTGTKTNPEGCGRGNTTSTLSCTDGFLPTVTRPKQCISQNRKPVLRGNEAVCLATAGTANSGVLRSMDLIAEWSEKKSESSSNGTSALSEKDRLEILNSQPAIKSITRASSLEKWGDSSTSIADGGLFKNSTKPMIDSGRTASVSSIAEWNGHKHQPIPTTDRWLYLVQYTAGAEGWNCIETDAMIMFSQNYSWKITEQAYGRIDRLNTPFEKLWYYGFTSGSWIDKAIGRALKAKESFNEAKYSSMFRGSEV